MIVKLNLLELNYLLTVCPTAPDKGALQIKKALFWLNEYHKYGLYYDDVYQDEFYTAPVQEAVRRLPAEIYDMRNYRQIRAIQLEINKEYLPEEEWISYEEDQRDGHYMQSYVDQVKAEMKEREDWEKAHSR